MQQIARIGALVAVWLILGLGAASAVDQAKEVVFQEAKSAYKTAQSLEASFFAPKNYAKAIKHYRNAERKFASSQDAEAFRAELTLATEHFQKAIQISKAARSKFASTLKARNDAEKVKAPSHANALWRRAEQKLSRAIGELEDGTVDVADQRAGEAEQLYRDAELNTIKSTYLREARLTLAQAEREKVGKYAPKTLQKAKELLAQAESTLEKNRYDADEPRSLAQQAVYEVKHAMYLAKTVKKARDEKLTTEDVILDWETPLRQIAAAANMTAGLDSGYEAPAKQIIGYIESQQDRSQRLQQDKNDLKAEIEQLQAALTGASEERAVLSKRLDIQIQRREKLEQELRSLRAEVQELQLSLGGVSEERVALSDSLESQKRLRENLEQEINTLRREIKILEQMVDTVSQERLLLSKRLESQERILNQFEKIENMFARDEAQVSRQYNDIILRLVGLNFPSGRSTIQPGNFQLLAKVTQAIQLFSDSELIIEGHTDSYGSDAANLTLSQKRADAVKQYLVANMPIDPSKMEAIGYGETRPVANNETKEGRAKNRRIDVIISPKLSFK